jgi:hypothetical protein
MQGMKVCTGFGWLRIDSCSGTCEHGDQLSGFTKSANFLTNLKLLKEAHTVSC